MPVHNKLVRDLIPDIIRKSGKTCTTRTLDDATYLEALNAKLDEEVDEYHAADSEHALEELADLLEVIYAISIARGFSPDELEVVRAEKARKRGGFSQRILLDVVTDDLS